jgi:proline iminopeptidase
MTGRDLYPPIEPFDVRKVAVDNPHTLHVEQSGKPDGVPVVFLHGGPGAIWSAHNRRFFDPGHYRLIAFDQRGTWRSTPVGELKDNTTPHLIADIEHLRELFAIERWIVFGGSWGSALGLAYAEHHPERCLGVVLRGISLGLGVEGGWSFHQSRWIRPEAWEALVASIPPAERGDLDAAIERRIMDPDPAIHRPVVKGWMDQAEILGKLRHADLDLHEDAVADDAADLVCARISIRYFRNHLFLPPGSLLDSAHRLKAVPGVIVHGMDDFNTPLANAYDLHRAWPEASYRPIPDAGHSCFDRNNRLALVAAMEKMKGI